MLHPNDIRLSRARFARTLGTALVLVLGPGSAAAAAPDLALARADSLWVSDQRSEAMEILSAAIEDAEAAADTTAWIEVLTRRSQFLKQDSLPVEAEEAARSALALAIATGDSSLACAPRRWLGVALTGQGRNAEAAAQYHRLASLATAVADTEHAAWASVGLGWDADLQRDHPAAHEQYGRAAGLFASLGDDEGQLWAELGRANADFHLGRYQKASTGWNRVADLARSAGLARHEAITRNNIAGLQFALGRPDISLHHYERAVAIWDSLGQSWERMPPALNLGSCLALLGHVDQARELFERELAACRAGAFVDYEARALRKLADLARDEGEFETAARYYRQVLDLGEERSALERLDALLGLASLDEMEGDSAAALEDLADADRLLAGDMTSQARIRLDLAHARSLLALGRAEPARALLARVDTTLGTARARFGMELELRRADLHDLLGEPDAARTALERAAEIWEQERGLPLDPDWRTERGTAGRDVFVRLARRIAVHEGPAAAFDRLQQAKARTLREQVLGPGSNAAVTGYSTRVTVADLQNGLLRPGEILLDAHLAGNDGILFVVTRDTCRRVDLMPGLDLGGRVNKYLELLGDPRSNRTVRADSAAALRRDLLAPIADLLDGAREVVFSPDGALHLLPLALLLEPDSRIWTRTPSASLWADLRLGPAPPAESGMNILTARKESARRLNGAAWLAEDLAARYRGVEIESKRRTAADLEELQAGVLHVGAHVRADARNAWQSAVLLDDGPTGEMRAGDIATTQLSTPLVVLASCSSAQGRVVSGEGVQGLSHAFLIAGARTVLATLWPVDDDLTAAFMKRFYAHLADGGSAAEALAATRGELRTDPTTAQPFAWAGFVLLGDGDLRVQLEPAIRRPAARTWILAVIGMVMAFAIVRGLRRSRRRGV